MNRKSTLVNNVSLLICALTKMTNYLKFQLLKGAESRPRMYFGLVARGLYLRNYCWYSKKPKTYAIRLAKAVHIANYERWKCQTETWRARLDTTLRLIKLSFTQAVELQIVHIYVLQQGEDSNRELFRVLCLKVRFWAAYLVVFLIRGSLLTKTLCYCLYLVANSHISKFGSILKATDRVLLRNVLFMILPGYCQLFLCLTCLYKQWISFVVPTEFVSVLQGAYMYRSCIQ